LASGACWDQAVYLWDTKTLNCVGRVGVYEQIINVFKTKEESLVVHGIKNVYKFDQCNLKGYVETPTVHDWTSSNFLIVDNGKNIIGGVKSNFLIKVNLDNYKKPMTTVDITSHEKLLQGNTNSKAELKILALLLCRDDKEFLVNTWDSHYRVGHIYRLKVDKLTFVGLHISSQKQWVFKRMIVFGDNGDKLVATTTEAIRMYLLEDNNMVLLKETKIEGYT